uniref:GTP-binding protein Rheb n=1 Tax=Amazona collaria TaxID=241587 RepID=A0A8B9F1K3_9PSIT
MCMVLLALPPCWSNSLKCSVLYKLMQRKSSLTIQFVEGQFVDSYDPTIENTFTKLITVNGQEYHLQLVDTAGQDEYSIFPQTYSIDINGYILVYSVTSIKSFEVIKVIHGKLLDMVGKVQIPIMLVGNKKDLHMERVISYEEGKALAESWNAAFLESSAKENQITFYEGKCFTGRKLEVCGSCGSFQDQGFLNRVNSICVQSGAWVCFDHPNFRGQQYVLEHGEYPDFYRWNGCSDHLGSCRPVGMVGAVRGAKLPRPYVRGGAGRVQQLQCMASTQRKRPVHQKSNQLLLAELSSYQQWPAESRHHPSSQTLTGING